MSNLASVYAATLVVAVFFVGCCRVGGKDIPLVNEICGNAKHPSKSIVTVADLAELAEQIKNTNVDCPDTIKSSIEELNNLIFKHEKDVCTQATADDIAEFYRKHLAIKDAATNSLIDFPKALKKFFIAYGLRVSGFCRTQMARLLIGDVQRLIEEADLNEVAGFTGQRSWIAAFIGDSSERKNEKHFAFPKNLIKMMISFESFKTNDDQKLFLQLSDTKRFHRIQAVCDRRFRPIYKDLILPLVTLAEVGFNYNGEDSSLTPVEIKQIYDWYRIVFLCEAMNMVEIFQSREDNEQVPGSHRRVVRILEKEEAEKLRTDEYAVIESAGVQFQPIEYKPDLNSLPLDGAIYDGKDSKLEKAIMAFRRQTRNENDPDMAHKVVNFLESRASRSSVKIIGKLTGIKDLPADGKLTGIDLVKLLAEYQNAIETRNLKPRAIVWLEKALKIGFVICLTGFVILMIVTACMG